MRIVRPLRSSRGTAVGAASLVGAVTALGMALSATPALADDASDSSRAGASVRPVAGTTPVTEQQADRALAVATRVIGGEPRTKDPDPSIALRNLRLSLPALDSEEHAQAVTLLARPTDGAADPENDGYTAPSFKKCSTHFCVHYVKRTVDKPTAGQVDQTLAQLNRVWKLEIDKMHYRRPLSDGKRGGNAKLDVYLKDIGDKGYYGYCAAERRYKQTYTFSSYCVLDNDYTNDSFEGADPLNSLKVTAGHEFFHAVQYAYDADEDAWLMESTATWMEEQVADSINDNLQYLRYGQLGDPSGPLDAFVPGSFAQYGNWVWWEFLSERYNPTIVRSVWTRAGSYKGAADEYSTQALRSVLAPKGGFGDVFARYASVNTSPATFYDEGASWTGSAAPPTAVSLGNGTVSKTLSPIDHMASRSVAYKPASSLTTANWHLDIKVDGPAAGSPYAVVLVTDTDGTAKRTLIPLDGNGDGTLTVPFVAGTVAKVTLTLVNASTQFKCWTSDGAFSCHGTPKRDELTYSYTVTATNS